MKRMIKNIVIFVIVLFTLASPVFAGSKGGINIADHFSEFAKAANTVGPEGWVYVMACPGDVKQLNEIIKKAGYPSVNLMIRGHYPGNNDLDAAFAHDWAMALSALDTQHKVYFMPVNEPNNKMAGRGISAQIVRSYTDSLIKELAGLRHNKVYLLSPMIDPFQQSIETGNNTYADQLGGASYFSQFDGVSLALYGEFIGTDVNTATLTSEPLRSGNYKVFTDKYAPGMPVYSVETGPVVDGKPVYGTDRNASAFFQKYLSLMKKGGSPPSWEASQFKMFSVFSYDPEKPSKDDSGYEQQDWIYSNPGLLTSFSGGPDPEKYNGSVGPIEALKNLSTCAIDDEPVVTSPNSAWNFLLRNTAYLGPFNLIHTKNVMGTVKPKDNKFNMPDLSIDTNQFVNALKPLKPLSKKLIKGSQLHFTSNTSACLPSEKTDKSGMETKQILADSGIVKVVFPYLNNYTLNSIALAGIIAPNHPVTDAMLNGKKTLKDQTVTLTNVPPCGSQDKGEPVRIVPQLNIVQAIFSGTSSVFYLAARLLGEDRLAALLALFQQDKCSGDCTDSVDESGIIQLGGRTPHTDKFSKSIGVAEDSRKRTGFAATLLPLGVSLKDKDVGESKKQVYTVGGLLDSNEDISTNVPFNEVKNAMYATEQMTCGILPISKRGSDLNCNKAAQAVTPTTTGCTNNTTLPNLETSDNACQICGANDTSKFLGQYTIPPTMVKILQKAGETYHVPASVLLGVMYHEGAFSRFTGDNALTEENVKKWSMCGASIPNCKPEEVSAAICESGTKNPDICGVSIAGFGWLPSWFWQDGNWAAVQQVDSTRTKETISPCNFLDAAFAAAKSLKNVSGGDASYTYPMCFGTTFLTSDGPATSCSWSKERIFTAERKYIGYCSELGKHEDLSYFTDTAYEKSAFYRVWSTYNDYQCRSGNQAL